MMPVNVCYIKPGAVCYIKPGTVCYIKPGAVCYLREANTFALVISPGDFCIHLIVYRALDKGLQGQLSIFLLKKCIL